MRQHYRVAAKGALAPCLLLLLATTACNTDNDGEQTSSSTHWIQCDEDAPCVEYGAAACQNGYCVDQDGDRVKASGALPTPPESERQSGAPAETPAPDAGRTAPQDCDVPVCPGLDCAWGYELSTTSCRCECVRTQAAQGCEDATSEQACQQQRQDLEQIDLARQGEDATQPSVGRCQWTQAWHALDTADRCEYGMDRGVCTFITGQQPLGGLQGPRFFFKEVENGTLILSQGFDPVGSWLPPLGFELCEVELPAAGTPDPRCACGLARADCEEEPRIGEFDTFIPEPWCPARCEVGFQGTRACGCACTSVRPPVADCAPVPDAAKEGYSVVENGCTLNCPDGRRGYADLCGCGCIADAVALEQCQLPPDPGPCDESQLRYAFDPADGTCKPFDYGGCQGNWNNFRTPESCEEFCRQ